MIRPMTYRVLVKPDGLDKDPAFAAAEKAGILIAEHENITLEKMKMDTGVVMACGPTAFLAYAREAGIDFATQWHQFPKVGDRVGFAKYAGKYHKDPADGVDYLLLADEDINCVLEA